MISPSPTSPRLPLRVYDVERNRGFVNVGTNHDTGAFAVASIRGWWRAEGAGCIPRRGTCSSRPTPAAATAGAAAVETGIAEAGR